MLWDFAPLAFSNVLCNQGEETDVETQVQQTLEWIPHISREQFFPSVDAPPAEVKVGLFQLALQLSPQIAKKQGPEHKEPIQLL